MVGEEIILILDNVNILGVNLDEGRGFDRHINHVPKGSHLSFSSTRSGVLYLQARGLMTLLHYLSLTTSRVLITTISDLKEIRRSTRCTLGNESPKLFRTKEHRGSTLGDAADYHFEQHEGRGELPS